MNHTTRVFRVLLFWLSLSGAVSAATGATEQPDIAFEFALYFSPQPKGDPEAIVRTFVSDPKWRLALDAQDSPSALARVAMKWLPLADYAPPTAESLRYKGMGVPPEAAAALAQAKRVFVVVFTTKPRGTFITNRAASVLFLELAKAVGGLIWDEETRELFSREEWEKRRVETWQDNLPDVRSHVTMHAYANPDLLRIITLGMRKFGLPDLVFPEVPRQHSRSFGNTINALAQRLAEGQRGERGRFHLRLADIRHRAARESALSNPENKANGAAELALQPAELEKGDSNNMLWRIDFPAEKGDAVERGLSAMDRLYGSTDSITNVKSADPEMTAARERARAAFFAQEKRFRAGLGVGEALLVKAPFTAGDQTEYMWVEVVAWGPQHIEGRLSSDPFYVKSLRAGARVKVSLAEVYDYILYKPGGVEEGNETGKVLDRRKK